MFSSEALRPSILFWMIHDSFYFTTPGWALSMQFPSGGFRLGCIPCVHFISLGSLDSTRLTGSYRYARYPIFQVATVGQSKHPNSNRFLRKSETLNPPAPTVLTTEPSSITSSSSPTSSSWSTGNLRLPAMPPSTQEISGLFKGLLTIIVPWWSPW